MWLFGIGLGGAICNLIDRLFRAPGFGQGHVVDMINYNGWFVGNVADIAIVGAAIGVAVLSAFGVRLLEPKATPESRFCRGGRAFADTRTRVSDTRHLPVPDALVGERADVALARMLGLSRTRAAEIVEAGGVWQAGSTLGKSDLLVRRRRFCRLARRARGRAEPPIPGGLRVVYEDEDIASSTSPLALPRTPRPAGQAPPWLAASPPPESRCRNRGPPSARGSCTASTWERRASWLSPSPTRAYSALKHAFKERTVEKIYHAVAQGHLDPTAGTIDAPIGRHPSSDYKFAVVEGGRPSVTHYEVLEMFPAASLVEIHLETGRTHQIRVHMAAMRHPLVG